VTKQLYRSRYRLVQMLAWPDRGRQPPRLELVLDENATISLALLCAVLHLFSILDYQARTRHIVYFFAVIYVYCLLIYIRLCSTSLVYIACVFVAFLFHVV